MSTPFDLNTGNDGYSDDRYSGNDGYSGLNPLTTQFYLLLAVADKIFGNFDKTDDFYIKT